MGGNGIDRQLVLYTGVLAGTMGQWLFVSIQNEHFVPANLVLGLIASVVTFPSIWSNAGLNKEKVNFVKWCVAFQNGFFWPVLLELVGKSFQQ